MTSVNVSSVTNTVTVTGEGAGTVVTITTAGPQGPPGPTADLTALEARVAALEAAKYLVLQDGN
jgi:hypothetical protein